MKYYAVAALFLALIAPKSALSYSALEGMQKTLERIVESSGYGCFDANTLVEFETLQAQLEEAKSQSLKDAKFEMAYNPNWLNNWLPENLNSWGAKRVSAFYMDIDNFKFVNSTYGHGQADVILGRYVNHLTQFLKDNTRPGEAHLVRIGGDEFVILFKDVPVAKLQSKMQKLVQSLANDSSITAGLTKKPRSDVEEGQYYEPNRITISGGLDTEAVTKSRLTRIEAEGILSRLLDGSDKALLEAKNAGRNQFTSSPACLRALIRLAN